MTGQDRLQRLIADVDWVRRYAVAVIADARRAGVGVPIGVTARSRSGGPGPTGSGSGPRSIRWTTARAWRWSTSRPFRIRARGLRPGP